MRILTMVTLLACAMATGVAADSVKGTLVAKNKSGNQTLTIRHAYLVTGPDIVNPGRTVRWLLFSSTEHAERIRKCSALECVGWEPGDGFLVIVGSEPEMNYRHTVNKGGSQWIGAINAASLKRSVDTTTRLAGTLRFDNQFATVDVDFDLTVLRTFTR